MSTKEQRNKALCHEIAQVIRETNMSPLSAALIFNLLPETLLYKLDAGLIRPTPMQLIEFMNAAHHSLDKICFDDYKN